MSTEGATLVTKVQPTSLYNQSVAQQGAGFATDTYLTGSSISIPNSFVAPNCLASMAKMPVPQPISKT